jgi:predicted AAA+ superfamily ATPase
VNGKTIARYLDLLVDLLLVRRLQPLQTNVAKRLVKLAKVFVRDSGLLHSLLGLDDRDAVYGHPVVGGSWEGFVVETLLSVAPERCGAWFYRTAAGAEMDLVLDLPSGQRWGIEVERGLVPKLGKGFHKARVDLAPDRTFVVIPAEERYPLGDGVEAIGVAKLAGLLS